MLKTVLKNYAKLLARSGLNVQQGQEVIIAAQPDQVDFVMYCAEECYRAGASRVRVEWAYQPTQRLDALYQSEETLGAVPAWQEEKLRGEIRTMPARLYIESEDPDGMNGIDSDKYARAMQARQSVIKPYRDRMENKYQWCIAAVPGRKWAKKVFPTLTPSAAEEQLWRAILSSSRSLEGNPIANWDEHNRDLQSRCKYINDLGLSSLEYHAQNGTNFRVGLIKNCQFAAGSEKTLSGIEFNPNIPTEECFTSPMRGEAEGIVYSSKPLSYQGQLIRDFSVRFENGRAVETHAAQGDEVLKKMIAMDEGASYLGECAFVPYESPINQTGILFYNTLFDENAACHLALGRGFTNLIEGFENFTEEQLHEKGINDSMIHVDFMIGTQDMEITGITDTGARYPIFKQGNWAFKI